MSAGPWRTYSEAALGLHKGNFDLATDSFNLVLVTDAYTPSVDTDLTFACVSTNELPSDGSYTVGGVQLANGSLTLSEGAVIFAGTSPPWNLFTATFRYGVIVRRAGVSLAPGDLLLCYSDLGGGGSITGTGGILEVRTNASGILVTVHSP